MAKSHTYTPAEEAQFEIERRKNNKKGEYTPARNDEYRRKTGKELAELAGTPAKGKKVKEEKVAVHASTKVAQKKLPKSTARKLVDALTTEKKHTGPSADTILFNALKAKGGVRYAFQTSKAIKSGKLTLAEALK